MEALPNFRQPKSTSTKKRPVEKFSQGGTGQRGFRQPKNASTKKRLLLPMASVGGAAVRDKYQRKTGQGGSYADFLLAQECQHRQQAVSAHGVGGQSDHPWDSYKDS